MKHLEKLFTDKNLLTLALTHKSWVNENPNIRESNERLEFLGDAVLEFIVSKKIYRQFPDQEEGFLTALRANLVNTVNLARVAKNMNIGEYLLVSKGEDEGGGKENPSLLADTMESIIGAIFIDSGIEAAEAFIERHVLVDVEEKSKAPLKDDKSLLQERVQAEGMPTPRYFVISETGPDHNKVFYMEVSVNSKVLGKGQGKNKSEAAQSAAADALKNLPPVTEVK